MQLGTEEKLENVRNNLSITAVGIVQSLLMAFARYADRHAEGTPQAQIPS